MTQEDKQLLLKDLCARLPYGVKAKYRDNILTLDYTIFADDKSIAFGKYPMIYGLDDVGYVKPYLRPMSSMTEEEYEKFRKTFKWFERFDEPIFEWTYESYDWLNEHHFDYRDLIEKGLALEAPKDMYKIN